MAGAEPERPISPMPCRSDSGDGVRFARDIQPGEISTAFSMTGSPTGRRRRSRFGLVVVCSWAISIPRETDYGGLGRQARALRGLWPRPIGRRFADVGMTAMIGDTRSRAGPDPSQ
jgi:hypothetical protein